MYSPGTWEPLEFFPGDIKDEDTEKNLTQRRSSGSCTFLTTMRTVTCGTVTCELGRSVIIVFQGNH